MHVKYEILDGHRWLEVDQAAFFEALQVADGVYTRGYDFLSHAIIWFSRREAFFTIPKKAHVETITAAGDNPRTVSAGQHGLQTEFLHRYFGTRAKKMDIEIIRPALTPEQVDKMPSVMQHLAAQDVKYAYGQILGFIRRVAYKWFKRRPAPGHPSKYSAMQNICSESRMRGLKRVGADVMPDGEIADRVSPGEAYVYESLAGAVTVARARVR